MAESHVGFTQATACERQVPTTCMQNGDKYRVRQVLLQMTIQADYGVSADFVPFLFQKLTLGIRGSGLPEQISRSFCFKSRFGMIRLQGWIVDERRPTQEPDRGRDNPAFEPIRNLHSCAAAVGLSSSCDGVLRNGDGYCWRHRNDFGCVRRSWE